MWETRGLHSSVFHEWSLVKHPHGTGLVSDGFKRGGSYDCPMSTCAAPAGSPCRTGKGTVAIQDTPPASVSCPNSPRRSTCRPRPYAGRARRGPSCPAPRDRLHPPVLRAHRPRHRRPGEGAGRTRPPRRRPRPRPAQTPALLPPRVVHCLPRRRPRRRGQRRAGRMQRYVHSRRRRPRTGG